MVSFVESATLLLQDKASADIRKINSELKELFRTAEKLQRMSGKGDIFARGSSRTPLTGNKAAVRDLKTLTREAQEARQAIARMGARVDNSGLQQTLSLVERVNRESRAAARASAFGRGGALPPRGAAGRSVADSTSMLRNSTKLLNSSFLRLVSSTAKLGAAFALLSGIRSAGREAGQATLAAEDAKVRLRQAGFTEAETSHFVDLSRQVQEKFPQIPAAEILNASVEQLTALKIAGKSTEDYRIAMERVASNSQLLAVTYKDAAKGAEGARQAERFSQVLGMDINDPAIRKVQEAAMRALIASGGEMTMEEAVRSIQQLGPTIAKSMSSQALTDLLLTREEGGRASTAEWRTAIQDLMRDSLNPDDKMAMAKLGLRKATIKKNKKGVPMWVGGGADPTIVQEASANLVDFVSNRITPILEKAGVAGKSSAEIGAWLDEFAGFTTSGARAIADLAVSLREGEVQRQREAAKRVDLDPSIAANTFRGATQELVATFDTAMARNFDKLGPAFASGLRPMSDAMEVAGKQAEQGDFAKSATTLATAASDMIKGPTGTIVAGLAVADAVKTLATAGADPLAKSAAVLQLGASTLLLAATQLSGVADAATSWFTGKPTEAQTQAQVSIADEAARELVRESTRATAATDPRAVKMYQKISDLEAMRAGAPTDPGTIERMGKLHAEIEALRASIQHDIDVRQTATQQLTEAVKTERLSIGEPTLPAKVPIPTAKPVRIEIPATKPVPIKIPEPRPSRFGPPILPTKRPTEMQEMLKERFGGEKATQMIGEASTNLAMAFGTGATEMNTAITSGALTGGTTITTAMTTAGPSIGSAIMSQMLAQASTVGSLIGTAASAKIQSAAVNVNVASAASTGVDTGAQTAVE